MKKSKLNEIVDNLNYWVAELKELDNEHKKVLGKEFFNDLYGIINTLEIILQIETTRRM